MFKVPSDPVQLEKWRQAVAGSTDRVLTADDYLCRLHFAPECIKRLHDDDDDDDDDDTEGIHLGCPRLVEGAVPEIFPNSPPFPSLPSATKRSGPSLDGSSSNSSVRIPLKVQRVVQNGSLLRTGVDDSRSRNLFSELHSDAERLCPESWRSICNDDYVCFVRLQIISGQAQSTLSVSVSKDLDVRVFHGGLSVCHSFPDHVLTRADVTTMLEKLGNSQIFVGSPRNHLADMRSADLGHADDCPELDLSTICNPDTSITDM